MLSRKPDCRICFDVAHLNMHRTKSPVGVRHNGGARDDSKADAERHPVGLLNDEAIRQGIEWSDDVVAAWGARRTSKQRRGCLLPRFGIYWLF